MDGTKAAGGGLWNRKARKRKSQEERKTGSVVQVTVSSSQHLIKSTLAESLVDVKGVRCAKEGSSQRDQGGYVQQRNFDLEVLPQLLSIWKIGCCSSV